MIPKIVHYCWFGGKERPSYFEYYIDTWQKYLPGYEIKEWNENNFDINSVQYVKEAYSQKMYAFVSDYVRIYALYNYGGIYFDTDVEVIKNFDELLVGQAFIGYEKNKVFGSATIGSESHFWLFRELLDTYNTINFIKKDGMLDVIPNVEKITQIIKDKGFSFPQEEVITYLGINIYSQQYFSPRNIETGVISVTKQTFCIHHSEATWLPLYWRIERDFWHFFHVKNLKLLQRIIYIFKFGTIRTLPQAKVKNLLPTPVKLIFKQIIRKFH